MDRRKAFVHGWLMLLAGVAAGRVAAEGGTGGVVFAVLLFTVLAYAFFVEWEK